MTGKNVIQLGLHLVAGFLVRPCCLIPMALAVLGASGVGVAAALAPYRLWFLVLAAGFFSVSFYWNFIRNRNRAGMVVWGLSVLIAGVFLFGPRIAEAFTPVRPAHEERNLMTEGLTKVEIPVEGMACQACARRLERVLGRTEGIVEVQVGFEDGRTYAIYDPHHLDLPRLGELIRRAGFTPDLDSARVLDSEINP
jgi:copper chaperone CopZ